MGEVREILCLMHPTTLVKKDLDKTDLKDLLICLGKNVDWQLTLVTSLAARYTPGWETNHNFGRFHHCSLFSVGNEKGQWVKILDSKSGKIENPGSIQILSINRSHTVALSHNAVTELILTSRRTTFLDTKTRSLNLIKIWKFPSLIIPWISSDTRSNLKNFFFKSN